MKKEECQMADIGVFPLPKNYFSCEVVFLLLDASGQKIVHYWAILNIFSCTLGHSTSYVAVFPHYRDFFF